MSEQELLTSYSELADVLANLPLLVRERRRADRLSVRAAGAQMGMSASTISRLENGESLNESSLASILRWLDRGGR